MWRFIALVVLVSSVPAHAQPEEPQYRLDTVNVTATRTSRTAEDALASVTVIERGEIERIQARSIDELVRGLAGISVAVTGGAGKDTYMFVRGSEPDHVLVLVDGVKVGSATTGLVAFQDLSLDAVERIEIVRGPCSSLYGSEAIGGVIQIFTRSGHAGFSSDVAASWGGLGTYGALAGITTGGRRGSFSGLVSRRGTDGFNARAGSSGNPPEEPDPDGYRNLLISGQAEWRAGERTGGLLHYLRSDGHSYFDGSFVNESRSRQEVLGTRVRLSPAVGERLQASIGIARDRSSSFKSGAFQTRFDTRRYSAELQNDLDLGRWGTLTAGLSWQQDQVSSTTDYPVQHRNLGGVFGQCQASAGASRVRLSLRRDVIEGSSGSTTGTAALGRDLRVISCMAAYSTAFKTPTFNELYYPGFGNPGLRPERSRSLEVGVARSGRLGRASANAFENRVDDLIAYDAASGGPMNLDRARIRGVEAQVMGFHRAWQVRASITLLDPQYRGPVPGAGSVLPLRARRSGRLDVDGSVRDLFVGATVLSESRRFDDLANTVVLPSYATLALRVGYSPFSRCHAQLQVENVLDASYQTVATYNQAGRTISVTLQVR